MAGYKEIGPVDLAWRENRERIALQARQLTRRILDVALVQLDTEFQQGLRDGKILELDAGKEELKALLLKSAQRELGPGEDV